MTDDETLGAIETHIAMLMRLGEASRRSTGLKPHRALDRAAYVILRHLQQDGPQNVSALAARLNLDGSTVTRQVTALERDGLVERQRDPRDGRGTVIEATAKGLGQVDAVRQARRALYDKILHDWSPEQRAGLARMLERLTLSIDEYVRRAREAGPDPGLPADQVEDAISSGDVRAFSSRGSVSSAK